MGRNSPEAAGRNGWTHHPTRVVPSKPELWIEYELLCSPSASHLRGRYQFVLMVIAGNDIDYPPKRIT